MNKSLKIVLSILGVGAIAVPAVLLIFFTAKEQSQPGVSTDSRQINPGTVEEAVNKNPKPVFVSPSPASPSAKPNLGSSPSAR